MNTEQVAKRLVDLCRQGKYQEAQDELYSNDAVSVEMEGSGPRQREGARCDSREGQAVQRDGRGRARRQRRRAIVVGNWFAVTMTMDATMKGRGRVNMQEICVYQVKDGKIVREQFFYDLG